MCLDRRLISRKARIFLAIGNLCLFTGVSLNLVSHNYAAHHLGWLDFARGFLLGLAIIFLFFAASLKRRQPQPTR